MNSRHSGLALAALLLLVTASTRAADEIPDSSKSQSAKSGQWVVNRVRFVPAPERAQAMVGGRFTGSNVSRTTGFITLAEITALPKDGDWTELKCANTQPYRWVRYEAPPGSHGYIAELEFYADATRLDGTKFGSATGQPRSGWKSVFDKKLDTWMNVEPFADGQYVGLDLLSNASTQRVAFSPDPNEYKTPQTVTLKCSTPGATIRYSLDGTTPGPTDGVLYNGPITIDKLTTLVAVAFSSGLAPSPPNPATYVIGSPVSTRSSFSIGNSLTGNAAKFPFFLRSTGRIQHFHSFLIGGSKTVKLWDAKESYDRKRWDEEWAKNRLPLDFFTVQPRDFDIEQEVAHELKFFDQIRATSPEVQPWIYAEWVEAGRGRPSDRGEVPNWQMRETPKALTWEESMSAMMLYVEEVQHRVTKAYQGAKRPRIIPVSLAMGRARNMIDRGEIPGVAPGYAGFYEFLFDDQVHVSTNGCYLVDLVWYGAMYGESPEGKMLPVTTTFTAEQARVLQRLAWDVVQNYPDCGVYQEGAAPVARPQASPEPSPLADVTPVRLSSVTPGAWFRYTLDGTTPTHTRGYISCGVISIRPGMTLKAIGYKNGMADSEVVQFTYPKHDKE